MKKATFLLILLAATTVVMLVSCASTIRHNAEVAEWVQQGDFRFQRFNSFMELQRIRDTPGSFDRVRILEGAAGSEQDIDRAIAAYEAALRLAPSYREIQASLANARNVKQQWIVDKPVAGKTDIDGRWTAQVAQVQTVQAQRQQEQERQQQEQARQQQEQARRQQEQARQQELARQQQEQERQQQERARLQALQSPSSTPNSPNDFDIANSALGGVKITKYKGTRTDVVIPETIDGLKVTEIGESSFALNYYSTSNPTGIVTIYRVVLPSTLIQLGRNAFCMQPLTSISFPASLRRIGTAAFYCNKFTSVVIPNGVTFVGQSAFESDTITSVVIPPSLVNYNMQGTIFYDSDSDLGFSLAFTGTESGNIFSTSITRITLPANVHTRNLNNGELRDAYVGNGSKAGTYVWTGRLWVVE